MFVLVEKVLLDEDVGFIKTIDLFGGMPGVRFDANDMSLHKINKELLDKPADYIHKRK